MKKLFSILAILMMVMTAWADEVQWTDVSTAQELGSALANRNANIRLTANIDLSGSNLFRLFTSAQPFTGRIDGNGHYLTKAGYQVDGDEDVNAAFISFANGARFENLKICNFQITQISTTLASMHRNEAILVANSTNCTYSKVSIGNCSILRTGNSGEYLSVVGGVVANSNGDTFTDCVADKGCRFDAYEGITTNDAYLGGIAGKATNSNFNYCYSSATLWSDDNCVGGIVGYLDGGSILSCLNTGDVTAQEKVGGIVGYLTNATVKYCVNTGTIADDENKAEEYRAGIVGIEVGSVARIDQCINYGSIKDVKTLPSTTPILGGGDDNTVVATGCSYRCQYNGETQSNISDEYYDQMLSGEYACITNWLYQSIDNGIDFPTKMPVPIPSAGSVGENYLCNSSTASSRTKSFSNLYSANQKHTQNNNQYNRCTVCGYGYHAAWQTIHIQNADGLKELARYVNSGMDLSGSTVCLDNDIDMSGVSYIPIGKGFDTPYRGTFDGQGHRIKNLNVDRTSTCVGFFGCVVGENITIKNLIIDGSCTIIGSGYGAAGIVGCLAQNEVKIHSDYNLTIENCGNEATVNGEINAAGLLGGVYNCDDNPNVYITLKNCYNTGTISGNRESAAFIGYGNRTVNVKDCFNTGTVVGCDANHSLMRCRDYNELTATNVYNLSTVAADERATSITADFFASGSFCYQFNKGKVDGTQLLYQNIDNGSTVDVFPTSDKTHGTVYGGEDQCPLNSYSNIQRFHTCDNADGIGACTVSGCTCSSFYQPATLVSGNYEIANKGNIIWFAQHVNNGDTGMNGKLIADINLGDYQTMIGTSDKKYSGTFDGDGHIVTVNYNSTEDVTALFRYVGSATIQNLKTTGSISTSRKQAAGVVGKAEKLTLDRVMSDMTISSSFSGDASHGGLVADISNTSTISNCAFNGKLLGATTEKCGGFIGWEGNAAVTIKNSYLNIAERTISTNGCMTFARYNNTAPTYERIYYTATLGGSQGTNVSAQKLRSGSVCYAMNGSKNTGTLAWTQNLETDTYPVIGTAGVHYARTMSNEWGTVVLPYDVYYSKSNDKYKLYKLSAASVSGNTGTLTFTEYDNGTIAAGTPMAVKKISGDGIDIVPASTPNYNSTTINSVSDVTGWTMKGTYSNLTDQTGIYFIASNKFWWAESPITIAPFRAWFTGPEPTNTAKAFNIVIEDEETSLSPTLSIREGVGKYLENGKVVIVRNGKKYNLNGQAIQ